MRLAVVEQCKARRIFGVMVYSPLAYVLLVALLIVTIYAIWRSLADYRRRLGQRRLRRNTRNQTD